MVYTCNYNNSFIIAVSEIYCTHSKETLSLFSGNIVESGIKYHKPPPSKTHFILCIIVIFGCTFQKVAVPAPLVATGVTLVKNAVVSHEQKFVTFSSE
jgi:hypothetical protein